MKSNPRQSNLSNDLELLLFDEISRIEKARTNLVDFTNYTKKDYQTNWHHKLIGKKLDGFINGTIKRLMIFAPPRHGKSELVSRRLPALILGINPNDSVIATSYGADLSQRMNRDVQRIIDSPEYQILFPKTILSKSNIRMSSFGNYLRNSDLFEIVGHRGTYRSAGVGGGIVGMGGDKIIIDDPIKNGEEANSETYREKLWEWYVSTLYPRLEKDGAICLTVTRWHEDDLAGRLLEQARKNKDADQWEVLNLQAICEEERDYDPRKIGEVLWPEKKSYDELMKIKHADIRTWNSQYQQNPSSIDGDILKVKEFRFFNIIPRNMHLVQSWDLSVKDKDSNDWAVGQVWGKHGPDMYLLAQVRRKMGIKDSIEAILKMLIDYPTAQTIYIEDKANGSPASEILERKISGIVRVTPKGSKEDRARAISYLIEGGNIYLPDPQSNNWVYDLILECAKFPNGKHDDQVDAMTQALSKLGSGEKSGLQLLEDLLTM